MRGSQSEGIGMNRLRLAALLLVDLAEVITDGTALRQKPRRKSILFGSGEISFLETDPSERIPGGTQKIDECEILCPQTAEGCAPKPGLGRGYGRFRVETRAG